MRLTISGWLFAVLLFSVGFGLGKLHQYDIEVQECEFLIQYAQYHNADGIDVIYYKNGKEMFSHGFRKPGFIRNQINER